MHRQVHNYLIMDGTGTLAPHNHRIKRQQKQLILRGAGKKNAFVSRAWIPVFYFVPRPRKKLTSAALGTK